MVQLQTYQDVAARVTWPADQKHKREQVEYCDELEWSSQSPDQYFKPDVDGCSLANLDVNGFMTLLCNTPLGPFNILPLLHKRIQQHHYIKG